jgi:hypothetical protein
MAARGIEQVREHIEAYFAGFKFPANFKLEDLPALWQKQKLEAKYNVRPVFASDGLVEFHYLKPDAAVEPVSGSKAAKAPKVIPMLEDEDDED